MVVRVRIRRHPSRWVFRCLCITIAQINEFDMIIMDLDDLDQFAAHVLHKNAQRFDGEIRNIRIYASVIICTLYSA